MTSTKIIYQFKITLSHITPPIWRRIQVPADITLHRFAATLITAMGWYGGHLHQFFIDGKRYGSSDMEFTDDLEIIDEREVRLKDIVDQGIKQFIFEYDFGDGWDHLVKLEEVVDSEKGVKYPRCIKGARNCPPEDCGGPHGYADFLEAIRDPKHPEHESMLEWIGGDFDPEEFDSKNFSELADRAKFMEEEWKAFSG